MYYFFPLITRIVTVKNSFYPSLPGHLPQKILYPSLPRHLPTKKTFLPLLFRTFINKNYFYPSLPGHLIYHKSYFFYPLFLGHLPLFIMTFTKKVLLPLIVRTFTPPYQDILVCIAII